MQWWCLSKLGWPLWLIWQTEHHGGCFSHSVIAGMKYWTPKVKEVQVFWVHTLEVSVCIRLALRQCGLAVGHPGGETAHGKEGRRQSKQQASLSLFPHLGYRLLGGAPQAQHGSYHYPHPELCKVHQWTNLVPRTLHPASPTLDPASSESPT